MDIMKFSEKIGFLHKERLKKLDTLLESYKRFGSGEFEIELRKLIECKGELTITQIARMFNRTSTTISDHIRKLENKGLIKTEMVGNKRFVSLSNKDRSA